MPGGRLAPELWLVFPASLLSKAKETSWPVAGRQKGLQTQTSELIKLALIITVILHQKCCVANLCIAQITVLEPFLGECFSPQCLKTGSLFHRKRERLKQTMGRMSELQGLLISSGASLTSLSRIREQRGHLKSLFFFLALIAVCFLPADPVLFTLPRSALSH